MKKQVVLYVLNVQYHLFFISDITVESERLSVEPIRFIYP